MKVTSCILFLCSILSAQTDYYDALNDLFNPNYNFYKKNYTSASAGARGNTGVAYRQGTSSTLLNPASLDVSKFSFSIETTNKNNVDVYDGIQLKQIVPTGVISLFSNIEHMNLSFGIILNAEQSVKAEGETSYMDSKNNVESSIRNHRVYELIAPMSYKLNNLSIGASLNVKEYQVEEILNKAKGTGSKRIYNAQIGLIYSYNDFSFGMSYKHQIDRNKFKINVVGETYPEMAETDKKNGYVTKFLYEQPAELSFGISWEIYKDLVINTDYRLTPYKSDYHYTEDYHVGVENRLNDSFVIRAGFMHIAENGASDVSLAIGDQNFITLGGAYEFRGFSFNVALMNSKYLLGGDQVYLKLGLEYSL